MNNNMKKNYMNNIKKKLYEFLIADFNLFVVVVEIRNA